nr:MAG TPA: hypothetical protein [Caudoviricetes sp.]
MRFYNISASHLSIFYHFCLELEQNNFQNICLFYISSFQL